MMLLLLACVDWIGVCTANILKIIIFKDKLMKFYLNLKKKMKFYWTYSVMLKNFETPTKLD